MKNGGVTLRDIYDVMNRLEEKFDDRIEKQEHRISVLENNQSRAMGIFSVLIIIMSSAMTFLWDFILGRRG